MARLASKQAVTITGEHANQPLGSAPFQGKAIVDMGRSRHETPTQPPRPLLSGSASSEVASAGAVGAVGPAALSILSSTTLGEGDDEEVQAVREVTRAERDALGIATAVNLIESDDDD